MTRRMGRRSFLEGAGAGAALVTAPSWLAGCGAQQTALQPQRKTAVPAPNGHVTYFDDVGVDQGLIERVIAKGLSRGGDFAEVFLQHKVSHWVGMEDGAVNRAYTNVDLGAGIRVLKGDATGFAYSEDLSEQALLTAADTAAAVADGTPTARPTPLAAVTVDSSYAIAVPWTDVGIDQKIPLIQHTEGMARARDKRIIKTSVSLSDLTSNILVATSEGLLVEDTQPMAVLTVRCVAEQQGQTETSYQSASSREGLDFLSPALLQRVAHEAGDYTTMLFDAVPPPVGVLPVVLATGITGILLHEAIGHGLEADFNRKGISIYADRIGQRIASADVTIVDDGTNPHMRGSINIDDEGRPTEKTVLVDKGILRSYLHDRISGRHYQQPSTGSGRRQSFRYPPVPRMRNTYMLNGPLEPEEIIESVDKGIYAEKFANGQVSIGAGAFTFYLKHGRLIENGKLGPVIKDANLIGKGPEVLDHVDMVGNDLGMYSGAGACGKDGQRIPVGFGLPTIRAGAISIGGRSS